MSIGALASTDAPAIERVLFYLGGNYMAKTRYNGEGSIRLRQDGRHEVRVSGGIDFATGQPVRISRYANTKEEAVRLLNMLTLSAGNHKLKNRKITLGEWLDLWLEVYMKNSLKQSTYAGYETYCKRHFKPALGQILLTDLTPLALQQFYNYKMGTEHLSAKTISNMNLCLHKALDQAYKEDLIPANPASALNLPKAQRPDVQILTRDEQAALVRASYNHRYGVFIRLVLTTGLRIGEPLGLMWEDFDQRRNMIHIKRTLNRMQIPGLPEGYTGPRSQTVRQYKQLFKYFVIAVAIVNLAVSLFTLFVSYPSRFSMTFVIILELLFFFCWSYLTYMERGSRLFQWITLIACTILFVSAVAGIFTLVWANNSIGITVGRRFIMNACFPCLLLFVGIVDRAGFTVSLLICLAMSTIGMFISSRFIRKSSRQKSHRCDRQ